MADSKPAAQEKADKPAGPLSAAEEAKLGDLLARQAAGNQPGPVVRLKVEPPHSSVTFGGVTVGSEYADVPAAQAADIVSESAAAGVTITQES